MIPYIHLTQFHLGPIPIQVWGLFVALGFVIGARASTWMYKQRGLEPKILWDLLGWIVISAMVFARVFHVLFYGFGYYLENPLKIFAIWEGGLSMMGGLFGALIVSLWFLKRKQVDVWKYADASIFGLPLGYAIGRIGCFLIHDHPGTATHFFLGVQYPDGVVRHDLGLYHAIDGAILFVLFLILAKRQVKTGTYIIAFLLWYGATRFFLDFLRVADTRYFYLTPAQYLSIVMLIAGLFFWKKHKLSAKN